MFRRFDSVECLRFDDSTSVRCWFSPPPPASGPVIMMDHSTARSSSMRTMAEDDRLSGSVAASPATSRATRDMCAPGRQGH